MEAESESADPESGSWLDRGEVATWLAEPPGPGPTRTAGFADRIDPDSAAWLTAIVRFTRPDGSSMFDEQGRQPARLVELERWVRRVGDPSLARVIGWWRPASSVGTEVGWVAPPLPTNTWPDRPLAILRPDWTARGDWLAIDHRTPCDRTAIEVAGRGMIWLGRDWGSPGLGPATTAARATFAASGPFADAYEWSFEVGTSRVTRTAVLIRGANLAILLQTEVGVGAGWGEVRWSLPPGITARAAPPLRTLALGAGPGRPTARLIPLGLPETAYSTERGSLEVDGGEVVLRQQTSGPNRCFAMLVSWHKKPPRSWRTLTVAERSAPTPPGMAFAARVGWGANQNGLLIYKSLGPGTLRSVLGHQTRARLLVAGFSPTGEVHPWVKAAEDVAPATAR